MHSFIHSFIHFEKSKHGTDGRTGATLNAVPHGEPHCTKLLYLGNTALRWTTNMSYVL